MTFKNNLHPNSSYLLICLMLCMIFVPAKKLCALTPVIIDDSTESVNLGRYMEILEDQDCSLTIDDVIKPELQNRWVRSEWDIPNFGFTRSAYWVRLSLKNNGSYERYRLELSWHLIDTVKLYYLDKNNSFSGITKGYNIPVARQENVSRSFLFDIPFFNKDQSVYMRVKSDYCIQLPLKIWKIEEYQKQEKNEIYIMGAFVGILIVMILYNLFLYISIRDRSYFYYSLYISSMLGYNLLYSGAGAEFFMMTNPALTRIGFPLSETIASITAVLFVMNFLNTRKNQPLINKLFIIIITISILNLIPPFAGYGLVSVVIQNAVVISGSILIIISSAIRSIVSRPAKILLISWTFLLSGSAIVILKNYGFIKSNDFTNNYFSLATILETVLLSFALAYRINIMKQEKDEAQHEALMIQKQATETLELKVSERTTELAAANEKLRELDRVKTDFFSNISHELRTPLTLILAPVEDALSGGNMDRESLEMIKRNGRNLLSLINDLLDVSRITAGKMRLNISETDLSELVKEFCGQMESPAKLRGIKLEYACAGPVRVFIDRERIQHVISNFFSNSFKFTPPGGSIKVIVKNEDGLPVMQFSDTGCGIPADKVAAIFDRFSQADTSTTRHYEGTGIGLSIVKELVELHGAEVSVASRYSEEDPDDHGTVFTVKFRPGNDHLTGRTDVIFVPESEKYKGMIPHVRGIDQAQNTSGRIKSEVTDNDKPSILVVEDSADLRTMLVNMLNGSYIVYEAADGHEALKLLDDTGEFDLVLSDIMMPGIDGYELLRRIRNNERFRDLPFIFLTARADDFMKLEGLDLGATDYITKPFNSGELMLRIRNQVELGRLRNAAVRNYNSLMEKLKSVHKKKLTSDHASLLDTTCAFIRENYMQELSREDLAVSAGMNPDTFGRLFYQHTGKTLNEYINELRISEAMCRLKETDNTVIRISIDVGFDNIRTFNRVFKKYTSLSPVEYREQAGIRN